jgi:septal ring factor EnvC (AmiA/AmiB activator)
LDVLLEAPSSKISAVITECRCAVAKVRHERAAKEGAKAAKRRQEQLEKEVREYHERDGRQMGSAVGNNRLTNFWRVVLHISDAMYAGASG